MRGQSIRNTSCRKPVSLLLIVAAAFGGHALWAQSTWTGTWDTPSTPAGIVPGVQTPASKRLVDQCGVAFKAHNYNDAIALCKQAAEMGDREGIEGVAIVYREARQCALAAQYYSLNAPARPAAQNSLGELYWLGSRSGCRDFPLNYAKARALFEDAANRGWKQAWANLAWMDELGEGAVHDRPKAIAELKVASEDEWNRDVMIALQNKNAPPRFSSLEALGQYAANLRFSRWMASQTRDSQQNGGNTTFQQQILQNCQYFLRPGAPFICGGH
jgi:hypothetical protein